jgi:hypothetical protein
MQKDTRKEVEILQHTIKYYYDNDMDMPKHEQEHVKEMIIEGYNQGELNCLMPDGDTEIRGWWQIVK